MDERSTKKITSSIYFAGGELIITNTRLNMMITFVDRADIKSINWSSSRYNLSFLLVYKFLKEGDGSGNIAALLRMDDWSQDS